MKDRLASRTRMRSPARRLGFFAMGKSSEICRPMACACSTRPCYERCRGRVNERAEKAKGLTLGLVATCCRG